MKNIIYCADGTWNHPHHAGESGSNTNVYKIYNALVQNDIQVAMYDDGVGADGTWLNHTLGGMFGAGLLDKIKIGYKRIAEVYQPGDAIHLFGFSRGAFTARSIAGMLAICGLPSKADCAEQAAEAAFTAYRHPEHRDALLRSFDNAYGHERAHVATIGVWDTVGALGIPIGLFKGLDESMYGFLDTTLHHDVGAAYQALSIDEERPEFQPTLWQPQVRRGQILEQVWFPGVHSDVGGGYSDNHLADITLLWMMRRASKQGLRLNPENAIEQLGVTEEYVHGKIHDSWKTWFGTRSARTIPSNSVYSNTVSMRFGGDAHYRPSNLPSDFPRGLSEDFFSNVLFRAED